MFKIVVVAKGAPAVWTTVLSAFAIKHLRALDHCAHPCVGAVPQKGTTSAIRPGLWISHELCRNAPQACQTENKFRPLRGLSQAGDEGHKTLARCARRLQHRAPNRQQHLHAHPFSRGLRPVRSLPGGVRLDVRHRQRRRRSVPDRQGPGRHRRRPAVDAGGLRAVPAARGAVAAVCAVRRRRPGESLLAGAFCRLAAASLQPAGHSEGVCRSLRLEANGYAPTLSPFFAGTFSDSSIVAASTATVAPSDHATGTL